MRPSTYGAFAFSSCRLLEDSAEHLVFVGADADNIEPEYV